MINLIIKYHKELCSENTYKIIDPNLKSNNLDGNNISQLEIIQNIQKNNFDVIEIEYNNKYLIKYTKINDNNIIISPLEPNSVHLIRLIGLKKIPNYKLEFDIKIKNINFADILLELYNVIDNKLNQTNPMDYCTVCGVDLKLKGLNKIDCCISDICKIQSKHIVMDNRITDLYKKDPYLCEILIYILIEGTTHPKGEKIFKPFPIIKNIYNLVELQKLLESEIKNLEISLIANCFNDIELNKNIGSNAYAIISNAIMNNYFSLSTIESFGTIENFNSNRFNKESVFDTKNVKFIGLNYSYEIESKFKKEYFLFHGTSMHSWYPIIKNGLKVMSGTEFMTNGSVYGNGIYLSDQFSMSLGYSAKNFINKYNKNSSRCIIGVFEIADKIEQYKKTNNIFVITDDKIMLLRYLIVIENYSIFNQSNELSDYFVKYLGSINKLNQKKSINIKNKRFNAEMKLLNNNSKVYNVDMIDEFSNWKIELNEIKGKKIKLNIYFNDYPKLPPKISLESELNKDIQKIICDDNSNIIIPEINPSKWEITTNLSIIIDIIHNCIMNLL